MTPRLLRSDKFDYILSFQHKKLTAVINFKLLSENDSCAIFYMYLYICSYKLTFCVWFCLVCVCLCLCSGVYTLKPCLILVAATHKDTSQLSPSAIHISPQWGLTQAAPMNEHSFGDTGSCSRAGVDYTAVFTQLFLTWFLILASHALQHHFFSFFLSASSFSCIVPNSYIFCHFFHYYLSVFLCLFFHVHMLIPVLFVTHLKQAQLAPD